MRPIVKVENLSKSYQIGKLDAGYATLREMIAGTLIKPFRRLRQGRESRQETLWALKDLNFSIEPGETVGLIGHNGAGKSTLLKILSRITVPTTGRTEVYGKIGSLLEVGTGFHPDLTGRENIYLNGTILGIKPAEIARRFDEIVDFSGIQNFIDTPVKWYSSGMYLRLAFSVAVHLESEVLIMDEVLAVGDVSFQQKCLDKMHEIRQQGRTILFVSHSMPAVTRLCSRALLLDHGMVKHDGPAHQVVNDYLGSSWKVMSEREWSDLSLAPGNETVKLLKVRSCSPNGETAQSVSISKKIGIELTYEVLRAGVTLVPRIDLLSEDGAHVFASHDVEEEWRHTPRTPGRYVSTLWIPDNFLTAGNFLASASLVSHLPSTVTHAHEPKAITFQVLETDSAQSARGDYVGPISGVVRPLLPWSTELVTEKSAEQLLCEVQ